MRSLTGPNPSDVTRMSESGRLPGRGFRPRWLESFGDLVVARAVHVVAAVLTSAAMTACVIPPPLDVDTTDAGLNSPPIITDVRDVNLLAYRPPATITVNMATLPPVDLTLELFDLDVTDELTVRLYVDFDSATPENARITCTAPGSPDGEPTRADVPCSTSNLCQSVGPHRLEIEVYDRLPDLNPPYRNPTPPGMFSTWTFDLNCINEL